MAAGNLTSTGAGHQFISDIQEKTKKESEMTSDLFTAFLLLVQKITLTHNFQEVFHI